MNTATKMPVVINSVRPDAHMSTAVSCYFPPLGSIISNDKKPIGHALEIHNADLEAFLRTNSAEAPFLIQTLWALVLRCYTTQNDVCYAYEEKLGKNQTVGFVRLMLDESVSLAGTIKQAQHGYVGALESNTLNPPVKPLCNTILSITRPFDSSLEDVGTPGNEQVCCEIN